MGLLDFLIGGDEAQLRRHTKRVANLNAQTEDRNSSARWLAEKGSEEAIIGLFGRFAITTESQMKDAAEKELVVDLLYDLGPKVVGPAREWLRKNNNIAQPLRIIEHFEGRDAVVDLLVELIGRENDPFKTEKKRQLLIKLTELRSPRCVAAVLPILGDFDEGVRYAAVEVLLATEAPEAATALAAALANPDEDSNRVRGRIAEGFNLRRWSLGEHAEAVSKRPPNGWIVVGDTLHKS